MMKVKKQVGKSMLTLAIFALLCAPFDVDAKIIAGGSSQAKYKSMGSCIYPDRASAEVLVTNFLNTLQVYTKNYGGDEAQILFNYKNKVLTNILNQYEKPKLYLMMDKNGDITIYDQKFLKKKSPSQIF